MVLSENCAVSGVSAAARAFGKRPRDTSEEAVVGAQACPSRVAGMARVETAVDDPEEKTSSSWSASWAPRSLASKGPTLLRSGR